MLSILTPWASTGPIMDLPASLHGLGLLADHVEHGGHARPVDVRVDQSHAVAAARPAPQRGWPSPCSCRRHPLPLAIAMMCLHPRQAPSCVSERCARSVPSGTTSTSGAMAMVIPRLEPSFSKGELHRLAHALPGVHRRAGRLHAHPGLPLPFLPPPATPPLTRSSATMSFPSSGSMTTPLRALDDMSASVNAAMPQSSVEGSQYRSVKVHHLLTLRSLATPSARSRSAMVSGVGKCMRPVSRSLAVHHPVGGHFVCAPAVSPRARFMAQPTMRLERAAPR